MLFDDNEVCELLKYFLAEKIKFLLIKYSFIVKLYIILGHCNFFKFSGINVLQLIKYLMFILEAYKDVVLMFSYMR